MKRALLICLVFASAAGLPADLLVEAESFADLGGWSVDQQFMDQMGSPFLLAHGLGKPVAPAKTTVDVAVRGTYRLWVRTRDWVSPHGPGRFVVKVAGKSSSELGKGPGEWGWRDGGEFELEAGKCPVEIVDLTGFDGRVDALYLTTGGPPEASAPRAWRERLLGFPATPPLRGDFDLVVVGGGMAGMCASVAAAREGLRVALVHDRPVFGGCGSGEVRVLPQGKFGEGPFPHNADLMREIQALIPHTRKRHTSRLYLPDDEAYTKWVRAETNLTVFASCRAVGAQVQDGRISSTRVREVLSGRDFLISGRFFADCTGDASLAEAAGAETRWDAEWREETGEELAPPRGKRRLAGGLGSTNRWRARHLKGRRTVFPDCPWALRINSDEEAFVKWDYSWQKRPVTAGAWDWESGFYRDPVKDGEAIRDLNLRAIFGFWDYAVNRSSVKELYEGHELEWVGFILAKRDAHRIVGDYVLTANDILEHRVQNDGVVDTTWYLDLHFPHPEQMERLGDDAFRSVDFHRLAEMGVTNRVGRMREIASYPIPFRCLYSKDLSNLLMAGKDISGTYAALSSYRVQNTTGQMGTVVGRAVALCVRNGWTPRELARDHFDALAKKLSRPLATTKQENEHDK